ncbi:FH2 domain-containing protein 1-like [Dendropsophus ebraccatus]|uniref:FH2 domain-containing protein 1-like n=1 Tax=Dendropsophus ebraccatus TaxID=150705 RepID=UPI003831C26A
MHIRRPSSSSSVPQMDDTLDVSMVTNRNSPSPPLPPCPPPLPAGGIPLKPKASVSAELSLPSPPPPPGKATMPPPPPPPSYGICLPTAPPPRLEQRRPKLRNFNWDALPADRVLGGRNLWTCGPQGASLQIDVVHMEELFGQREEPRKSRGTRSFKARSYQGVTEPDVKEMSLLDSKKSMNLGIFLKQFKRPVQVMIADIRQGVGSNFGAEKLAELLRLLPEKDEVKRLRAFKGDRSRLSDPELFMVMMVEIPSFQQRLQVLILKEEFFPQLNSLKQAVEVQMAAATELLQCEDLHVIIHLVLKAGNYMNAGGYAGSAVGFRMGSLLRLADTKANKPGMNLMHFVAQEAERNNRSLLSFPEKLPHISQASRITSQEVESDLETLSQRLRGTREALRDQPDLRHEMAPFLQVAEVELCEVLCSLQSMRDARRALMDYFCEDESTFRLEEMCLVFTTFCAKFMAAIRENREREKAEHRKERLEKRRSIASCSSQDKDLQDVELEFLMLRLPRRVRSSRGPRALPRSHSTEVLNTSPPSSALPRFPVGTSNKVNVEPIREEDDHLAESKLSHGLRRPREDSTESEGQQETPGKMNRRHTLGCLPSYQSGEAAQSIVVSSPIGSSKDSLGFTCELVSTPCTPTANSLSQGLKSWTADGSPRDPPSPISGTPSPFRLGGLFHRRGSLKSPEPPPIQVSDSSPRGGSEASALTTFLRRFDNALRSPK